MMGPLVKKRTVLSLEGDVLTTAVFSTRGEDHIAGAPDVLLPRDTWEWMGEPQEITVTIEPGDRLS